MIDLKSGAKFMLHRAYRRDDHRALLNLVRKIQFPSGDCFAWVACESLMAKEIRGFLVGELGIDPKLVKASGYWRRDAVAVHDLHEN